MVGVDTCFPPPASAKDMKELSLLVLAKEKEKKE